MYPRELQAGCCHAVVQIDASKLFSIILQNNRSASTLTHNRYVQGIANCVSLQMW